MAPLKKNVNLATPPPPLPKERGKLLKWLSLQIVAQLSDIHICDAKDSHSNLALPWRMQVTEPKYQLNSEQLLSMLSTLRKRMEDQQTEMIWLHELTDHEKE